MTGGVPMGPRAAAAPEGEALLIGNAGAATGEARITARLDPHIVVLQADVRALTELARTARFAIVRAPDGEAETYGDESVLSELEQGAQLFVAAWRAQPSSKKDRPGEGLSWDAPGFEPPDLPTH